MVLDAPAPCAGGREAPVVFDFTVDNGQLAAIELIADAECLAAPN